MGMGSAMTRTPETPQLGGRIIYTFLIGRRKKTYPFSDWRAVFPMGMGSAMTRTPETPQQEPTSLPSGVTGIRSPYPTFTTDYDLWDL